MRKLASAIRKLKNTSRYDVFEVKERRQELEAVAESILLKMETCDEVIAKSVSREFADWGRYCKPSERWDFLYNRSREVMKEQWG